METFRPRPGILTARLTVLQTGSEGRTGDGTKTCHPGSLRHGILSFRENWRQGSINALGERADLSMMAEAGALDPADETFREYERVVDAKYLEEIRAQVKQFSTKLLSRQSRVAECAIRSFKNGKNTIKPRTLRKLTRAIHDLQNKKPGSL
jgi:hypothetical protein